LAIVDWPHTPEANTAAGRVTLGKNMGNSRIEGKVDERWAMVMRVPGYLFIGKYKGKP
jgi:hypothetical protein